MNFIQISEEYKKIFNEELPLKNFGVYIYHKAGRNNVDRIYFETKAEALKYAKGLEVKDCYTVKVLERTDCSANKGFNKLIWSSCKGKKDESFIGDTAKYLATFNPLTAVVAQNAGKIGNTAKNIKRTARRAINAAGNTRAGQKLKNLTSNAWQNLKKKLSKNP